MIVARSGKYVTRRRDAVCWLDQQHVAEANGKMSRISRGFHRIGIVLAIPLILLAGVLFLGEARKPLRLPECGGMFDDLLPGPKCRPKGVPENPFDKYDPERRPNYSAALFTLLAGLSCYGAFRGTGWIVDGFRA